MTAQYQTLEDNCVQACVASILDLPLREVPHVFAGVSMGRDTGGWPKLFKWASRRGYKAVWIDPRKRVEVRRLEKSGTYYMGNWPVEGGGAHAVVMRRGEIVFDPGRSSAIMGPALSYVAFEKKGGGCFANILLLLALYLLVSWIWRLLR
jgi:hypothetical protein